MLKNLKMFYGLKIWTCIFVKGKVSFLCNFLAWAWAKNTLRHWYSDLDAPTFEFVYNNSLEVLVTNI